MSFDTILYRKAQKMWKKNFRYCNFYVLKKTKCKKNIKITYLKKKK